jgi:hypothetical protein
MQVQRTAWVLKGTCGRWVKMRVEQMQVIGWLQMEQMQVSGWMQMEQMQVDQV